MPNRPPRPCAEHGCPELVYGGTRCALHQRPRAADKRPSAAARGYGHKWRPKRDAWLKDHPWCADIYGNHEGLRVQGVIVDHILPRRQGGQDDESNYQTLCRACNNLKTARDGSRRPRDRGD